MIVISVKRARSLIQIWVFILSIAAGAICASVRADAQQVKTVPDGQKAEAKGIIGQRLAETFTVNDKSGGTTVVVLTDTTSVRSNKKGLGIFRRGEDYAVTSLLRGLIVEVEGVGNSKGQLVAEKVRFNESDLKTAYMVESRVTPVEEANKKVAGQVAEAQSEAARANARISTLDNFDEKKQTVVYFDVNSYDISTAARAELDALAQEALNSTSYIVEVAGFADPSGNKEKNLELSQRRADAVVKYLAINGKVPMRRIVTPIGFGATRSTAATPEQHKMERRVEVKLMISRGMSQ
jgi:OmpA-OmpF porin, OOP family